MNYWTKLSVEFANQKNYLDELFKVYPIVPNLRRKIANDKWHEIEVAYNENDNVKLVKHLLSLELFPIKDSYVAYLKRDPSSIERNPQTINRIAGNLYAMGLDDIFDKCTEPKETNRQIGPMFKNWLNKRTLGAPVYTNIIEFMSNPDTNAILNVSDNEMKEFAKNYLGYNRNKGLDFVARFNGKYIIGEAKFLTDFGGHQNAQFEDAISTLSSELGKKRVDEEVIKIAIMDGVLYIEGNSKLYNAIKDNEDSVIISSLLLREFLYSI